MCRHLLIQKSKTSHYRNYRIICHGDNANIDSNGRGPLAIEHEIKSLAQRQTTWSLITGQSAIGHVLLRAPRSSLPVNMMEIQHLRSLEVTRFHD